MSQLYADCLNNIFKCLEDDRDLRSCLLVNRLWCTVAVPFFWTKIRNHNTLISFLPNESKEILHQNEIILTQPSNAPLFDYVIYIKSLEIVHTRREIAKILLPISDERKIIILLQEFFKMFMRRTSLKNLNLNGFRMSNIPFTTYPGATDCLRDLSELNCGTDEESDIYLQLSRISQNLQTLTIMIRKVSSNDLKTLITAQNDLQSLCIIRQVAQNNRKNLLKIIPFSSGSPGVTNLIKFELYATNGLMPLSFVKNFSNLRELVLGVDQSILTDFERIQHITFPQLRVLKFQGGTPRYEHFKMFMTNNGGDLEELHLCNPEDSSNLVISRSCPNLRSLYIEFNDNMETFKEILSGCQKLESIGVCSNCEEESLEVITKCSPENLHELKLYTTMEFLSNDLEPFFIGWSNRIPKKPLSLIIIRRGREDLKVQEEMMELSNKFKKLGVIRKFVITNGTTIC